MITLLSYKFYRQLLIFNMSLSSNLLVLHQMSSACVYMVSLMILKMFFSNIAVKIGEKAPLMQVQTGRILTT